MVGYRSISRKAMMHMHQVRPCHEEELISIFSDVVKVATEDSDS